MSSPERLTHRYGSRDCMCVLRHLVMIAALMSNQWIPTTSLTTWTTMGMDNSSLNSATEVLVAESRNSGGMIESTVSYRTTSAGSQLEPTTAVIPETTTSEPTTFVFPETTPETSTINSVITTTAIQTNYVTGFDALKSASLTVPMTTTSNNSSPVLLTLHPTTTTPETTSTILSTLHSIKTYESTTTNLSTSHSIMTTSETTSTILPTSHSISSSTLSSWTNVTWSTATSATSGVNRVTNVSNVVTNETLGEFTSSVTSAVTSTPTTNMTSLGDSSDIVTTYATNITSPESPTTITSTHSMANNATLRRELTTLEFGLAVGFGAGGGFLLIVLFIIAVSCIIRRNRKRKRDTMSEEPYPRSPVKAKRKKRTRKRSASSPTVGVDNVRLSPVTYGKSPVQRLVDKNKNAKIRRNKRGSVQEITQAFAENEDVESTQKQIQTSNGNTTTGMPAAVVTVVSETGNPIAGTNGLNNNNNNYDFVTGGIAVEPKTTEHKPKRPGPSVKARPQTGVGLKLQASNLPRSETNRTTSPISVSSAPSSPGVAEPLDDDEPFPPPPIVGYVNPTFEQFDPPIHNQPQGQKHLSDQPNRKVLLTQNSFGESQTDIDVQQNPLFGLSRVDK